MGLMEGRHICFTADRRHGIPGSGHAQETQQNCQRSESKFYNHVTSMWPLTRITYRSVTSQDKTDWTICAFLKNQIETFKRTMPLIQDLKNPAMRDRHWLQLKDEVQKPFDHNSKYSLLKETPWLCYFFSYDEAH